MSRASLTSRAVKKRLADGSVKTYYYTRKRTTTGQRFEPDSIGALLQAYRLSPEWRAKAKGTKATYNTYFKELEGSPNTRVSEFNKANIIEIRNAIAAKRGNGAATGFMRSLSALLGWAVEAGRLPFSPMRDIKALPGGELQAWTMEQAQIAIAGLAEPYRRVVVLALYTGQRRGDLCALTWPAYDGQVIRLKQEKTGTEVTIPVHPDLKRELDQWKQAKVAHLHGRILTTEAGKPWDATYLSKMLPRMLTRLKLPRSLNVHGLRKLAATRLAEAGCSAHEIASITGHKTLAMVQHYTKRVDQSKLAAAAMARLTVSSSVDERGQPNESLQTETS